MSRYREQSGQHSVFSAPRHCAPRSNVKSTKVKARNARAKPALNLRLEIILTEETISCAKASLLEFILPTLLPLFNTEAMLSSGMAGQ